MQGVNFMTFVGRTKDTSQLTHILQRSGFESYNLIIQSIEGPGGSGKSALFQHVLDALDLKEQQYLTLKMIANNYDQRANLPHIVGSIISSASYAEMGARPPISLFPQTLSAIKDFENICAQAEAEIRGHDSDDEDACAKLIGAFQKAISIGKDINEISQWTKDKFDAHKIEHVPEKLREIIPKIKAFGMESQSWLETLGIGNGSSRRNEIRKDFPALLARALVADLSAILVGYEEGDKLKPTLPSLQGASRLLLIIDDYESVQGILSSFISEKLGPLLQRSRFQSTVVIIGRDDLKNTGAGWDKNLSKSIFPPIKVKALQREELCELLNTINITDPASQERAWQDTEGYPFAVNLWAEEYLEGCGTQSAVMLHRFYERTTYWMDDKQREILSRLVFLEKVNIDVLKVMLDGNGDPKAIFDWFKREASIRDTSSADYRVRPFIRSRIIAHLMNESPNMVADYENLAKKVKDPV